MTMRTTRQRLIRKLLLLFITPPLLCALVVGILSSQYRRAELLAEADRELGDHVEVLRVSLPNLLRELDRDQLVDQIRHLMRYERVHGIALYDRDCRPIVRSEDLDAAAAKFDPLICDGKKVRPIQHRVIELGFERVLLRAEPLDGPLVGAIAVTYNVGEVYDVIRGGTVRLILSVLCVGLLLAAGVLVIAGRLGRALGDLVLAAGRVTDGDLSVRVVPADLLELGQLGRAFNRMTEGLQASRRQLEVAEARRREMERRLLHAQTLRAVGQVAASLAHDIASPLSTILGWSRLLAADPALAAAYREQAAVVAAQCERITRIVQRLLDVSRPTEPSREAVALDAVARDVAAFLSGECRAHHIDLELHVAPETPPVLAEHDRCLQLLINLCMNAIEAQPGGGRLSIGIAPHTRDRPEGPQRGVRLTVSDAGPGIPRERREAVFEPFYSTKGTGGGLGLAIVRDLVQEIDGSIELVDPEGGGTCFRLFLPSSDPEVVPVTRLHI